MKIFNKIMLTSLMLSAGITCASVFNSHSIVGGSSATYSPTMNFKVYPQISGYIAGMTGNYNPTTGTAMINDDQGNPVFKYINVVKLQPRNRQETNGKILIGSLAYQPKTSARGVRSHVMQLDSLLFGELSEL